MVCGVRATTAGGASSRAGAAPPLRCGPAGDPPPAAVDGLCGRKHASGQELTGIDYHRSSPDRRVAGPSGSNGRLSGGQRGGVHIRAAKPFCAGKVVSRPHRPSTITPAPTVASHTSTSPSQTSIPAQILSVCLQSSGYPEQPQKFSPVALFVRIRIRRPHLAHSFTTNASWSLPNATPRTSDALSAVRTRAHSIMVPPVVNTSSTSSTLLPFQSYALSNAPFTAAERSTAPSVL